MDPTMKTSRNNTVFFLSSVRKYEHVKRFASNRRTVPAYMLCFIANGSGRLIIDDTAHAIQPMQLYFLIPGMTLQVKPEYDAAEYYVLVFEPLSLSKQNGSWSVDSHAKHRFCLPAGKVRIGKTEQTFSRIQQLYDSGKQKNDASRQLAHLQFQELYRFILEDLLEQRKEGGTDTLKAIEQSIQYMKHHLHKRISLETLSGLTKLTPSSYSRSFKKVNGVSPMEYLTRLRMEYAKMRLSQGEQRSIKEISVLAGYESEFYFSRVFKNKVGLSPTLYVKRKQLKVASVSCLGIQDNLSSLGAELVAAVDCFRYPGMDENEHKQLQASKLEQLRQMKPDLIIADFFHAGLYEQLKQIASTFIIKYQPDWRATHNKIAELVGREQEAGLSFRQLEAKSTEVKLRLNQTIGSETVTLIQVTHQTVRIQGTANHPLNELVYKELGLKPGNTVPEDRTREETIPELLRPLESDHLFIQKHHVRAGSEAVFAKLEHTCFWSSVKAVRNNKLRFIPNWLVMSWTPVGRNRIMDELLQLTEK